MNRNQIAIDHISKVTMELPINDEIIQLQKCVDDLERYKKALDNTCDMLETYDLVNDVIKRKKMTQNEWKEWALKDD